MATRRAVPERSRRGLSRAECLVVGLVALVRIPPPLSPDPPGGETYTRGLGADDVGRSGAGRGGAERVGVGGLGCGRSAW